MPHSPSPSPSHRISARTPLQTFHLRIKDVTTLSTARYVLLCGTSSRAHDIAHELGVACIVSDTDRFTVLQPRAEVLVCSHGIGLGSIDTLLHELLKALNYSGASGFSFIRLGTCGGLGLRPGSIVLTRQALNGDFKPVLKMHVNGKAREFRGVLDDDLRHELMTANRDVTVADTMCMETFYLSQARSDGSCFVGSDSERRAFLLDAFKNRVRNFEMESLPLAAFAALNNVPAAVLCVVLVDRLVHDTPTECEEILRRHTMKGVKFLCDFVKTKLEGKGSLKNGTL